MARKFFYVVVAAFLTGSLIFYFTQNEVSRESVIVFAVAMLISAVVIAYFVHKNRGKLNDLTIDPSRKNIDTLHNLFLRSKNENRKEK